MKNYLLMISLLAGMAVSTAFSMQKSTLRRRCCKTVIQTTMTAAGAAAGGYAGASVGCGAAT